MNPYRTPSPTPSPLLPPHPTPPRIGDMVKVIKESANHGHKIGKVGYVALISQSIYMVTFIKKRVTTCGFFLDDEIEVIKRGIL